MPSGPRSLPRAARLLAVVLGLSVATWALPGGALAQETELQEAREELRDTRELIRARVARMRDLQRELNRLATAIENNEALIHVAEHGIEELGTKADLLGARTERLQGRLDARNREAYIAGPGAPVLYLLTATSAAEAAARVSFLNEMNRRDAVLAGKVEQNTERLGRVTAELVRLQRAREFALQQLALDQREFRDRLERSEWLYDKLQVHKTAIEFTISKYRPFATCPIDGPHAIADGFGIMHHHPPKKGGDHLHQGNDMATALGTPLVAVFDGVVTTAANKLGGLAVKLHGQFGYAYYAHLSRYGNLGTVEKGDVIGYAGATGNASGSHLHFEWHPGNGAAVDPYGFLFKVC
jgi:murein DD-endopeptidase MepM/ murein hydrolase activator NlpD